MSRVLLLVLCVVALVGCGDSADDPLAEGRSIYGDVCSACHGAGGQGGVGPALSSVLDTWPDCDGHMEWIRLGSDGWKAEHGDTYGATGRAVSGGMPPQADSLTAAEIAAVAAFERVRYGGGDRDAVLADCGLIDSG
ncbi:MAG TPA: c-type cytochrome [Acidimicrobiia bacterium]|nr:c-type cytochrome [Acidimicrobiia bacterium]